MGLAHETRDPLKLRDAGRVRIAHHTALSFPDVFPESSITTESRLAESLGIHPVMLYRWQMEQRRGELRENKNMKKEAPSPKRRPDRSIDLFFALEEPFGLF